MSIERASVVFSPRVLRSVPAPVRDFLLAPAPALHDPVQRRRARLLAALTLALAVHTSLGAVTATLFFTPTLARVTCPALYGLSAAYLACYLLARTRALDVAVLATVAVQLAVPQLVCLLVGPQAAPPISAASWMTPALLTTSMFWGARATLLLGALAPAVLGATMWRLHIPPQALGEAVTFLAAVTLMLFVHGWHRDDLESIRRAELRDRNRALEELRATLEVRVIARTADLAASNHELEAAYRTLEEQHATLLATEKMAVIGRLTAGFAHELTSPLGAIQASLLEIDGLCSEIELAVEDPFSTDDLREATRDVRQSVSVARLEAKRVSAFVRGLRNHTRDPGCDVCEHFDARGVLEEAVTLVSHAAREARASVTLQMPERPVEVFGVPSRLNLVVINLVANAIDAVGENHGGEVNVRLIRTPDEVKLEVADDGRGIPPAVRPRIFEPLFTTKPAGQGTGLGLSIVADIVKQDFGGTVEVESGDDGTVFTARLVSPSMEAGR